MPADWYDDETLAPTMEWWWAVEHHGHPAFFLRALLSGDFAPGRGPAPRHVLCLDGTTTPPSGSVRCGTCGEVPRPEDLVPIERKTGHRNYLDAYRSGRSAWKRPTDPETCWLCSTPHVKASNVRQLGEMAPVKKKADRQSEVRVCDACERQVKRVLAVRKTMLDVPARG